MGADVKVSSTNLNNSLPTWYLHTDVFCLVENFNLIYYNLDGSYFLRYYLSHFELYQISIRVGSDKKFKLTMHHG